jgi:capsule polysaccharide modification protein KpsS
LNKSLPVIQYLKLLYERIKLNNNLFELYNSLSHRLDLNNNFIFFPLHFQPERSSQPEASYFENQLLAIKLLSYNLPKGYLIYVKEHPRQFDNATPDLRKTHARNYNYYNQLNEIQGVKLVDLRIDSEILIKNACLVATLTGSSGWQALKMNKPVFVFGHPWYESCFGVFNISNSNDIKKAFGVIQNLNKNEIIMFHRFFKQLVGGKK